MAFRSEGYISVLTLVKGDTQGIKILHLTAEIQPTADSCGDFGGLFSLDAKFW